MTALTDQTVMTRDALVTWFETRIPHAESFGLEIEYGLVRSGTGVPVGYHEPDGQLALLNLVDRELGGEPLFEGQALIGLALEDGTCLTLEAGSAIEYSGPPATSMTAAVAAARSYLHRLARMARPMGISLLTGGRLPFGDGPITWVPKPRTPIMLRHFGTLGADGRYGPEVMGRSLSTQVTLDARDPSEYLDKLRAMTLVSPYVAALTANAPALPPTGPPDPRQASTRMLHWRHIDPSRCQQLTGSLRDVSSLGDLIDTLTSVPMIFRMTREGPVPGPGRTFAELMSGEGTTPPTLNDWIWHLAQLWPAVRPRHTLETRLPDGQAWSDLAVLPALWLGLIGGPEARRGVLEIVSTSPTPGDQLEVSATAGMQALHPADREICAELCRLAGAGLAARVASGLESAELVQAVESTAETAASGRTPADQLLSRWISGWNRRPEEYTRSMSVPVD